MHEETLDLKGLKCPLPALMTRRRLAQLQPGALLVVTASDPLAVLDIPHMCAEEGHRVESVTTEKAVSLFRIRRKD